MAAPLVAFVCEGPTCSDRWDSRTPRQAVAEALGQATDGEPPICVVREICLGHCQRGPSVLTMPLSPGQAEQAPWLRPDQSTPGARVHHPRSVAEAAALISAASSVDRGSRTAASAAETSGHAPVAANPEVA
jgi:hypothetical protein